MAKRYKVIFSSLIKDKDYFKDQMSMLGVSEDITEDIIRKAPVILKKNLSPGEARIYADAVLQAGGKVTIQVEDNCDGNAIVTLKDFIMCPQCGYKQVKAAACIKCGFTFYDHLQIS